MTSRPEAVGGQGGREACPRSPSREGHPASRGHGAGPDLGLKALLFPSSLGLGRQGRPPATWEAGRALGSAFHFLLLTSRRLPRCPGPYRLPVEAARIHSLEDDSLSCKERKPFSWRMTGVLPPRGRGGLTFLGRQSRMPVKDDTSVAEYCCRIRGCIFVS